MKPRCTRASSRAARERQAALHAQLSREVEDARLEEQASRLPDYAFETPDLSKTERKAERRRAFAQHGAVD